MGCRAEIHQGGIEWVNADGLVAIVGNAARGDVNRLGILGIYSNGIDDGPILNPLAGEKPGFAPVGRLV